MQRTLKLSLFTAIVTGFTSHVSATDLTCSDIRFTAEAIAAYESIGKACLEMTDRDGETYARLSAWVVAQTRSGTHLRFLYQDGKHGPSHKAELPGGFETMLGDQAVKLEDLAIRQQIDIYISGQYWSAPEAVPDPGTNEDPVSVESPHSGTDPLA